MQNLHPDLIIEGSRPRPGMQQDLIRGDEERQILGEHAGDVVLQGLGPAIELGEGQLIGARTRSRSAADPDTLAA